MPRSVHQCLLVATLEKQDLQNMIKWDHPDDCGGKTDDGLSWRVFFWRCEFQRRSRGAIVNSKIISYARLIEIYSKRIDH